MRNDADLREKVIALLAKELGSITKAEMSFVGDSLKRE